MSVVQHILRIHYSEILHLFHWQSGLRVFVFFLKSMSYPSFHGIVSGPIELFPVYSKSLLYLCIVLWIHMSLSLSEFSFKCPLGNFGGGYAVIFRVIFSHMYVRGKKLCSMTTFCIWECILCHYTIFGGYDTEALHQQEWRILLYE